MATAPLPTLVIRGARPADRAAVERLLVAANLPLAGVAEHFDEFLVAAAAEGVVGAIAIERYRPYGLLRSVVVDDRWRGRGLGALLVSKALARAREDGLAALYLLTTTAADWFPRFGFKTLAREALPEPLRASEELRGACPETAVCLELILKR
jgi:amino-acid N-acetyltransferase